MEKAYGVFDSEGVRQGWATDARDAVAIAAAVAMRSLADLEVRDPDGKPYAYIGVSREGEALEEPWSFAATPDPDHPLVVHLASSHQATEVQHGDGSVQTLYGEEGQHTYAAEGSYEIVASSRGEQRSIWVTLVLPPTDLPGGEPV